MDNILRDVKLKYEDNQLSFIFEGETKIFPDKLSSNKLPIFFTSEFS